VSWPTWRIFAADDGDAVRQATTLMMDGLKLEVWDRKFERLIGRLPH
jgi:hypothetical protein